MSIKTCIIQVLCKHFSCGNYISFLQHQSSRVAYPLIDASTAGAKTAVKVESIALQNILSFDQTAYCLQTELSK